MRLAIAVAFVGVLLSACSTTSEKAPSAAAAPVASTPAVTPVVAETEAQREARLMKVLGGKSIYFDYDNYSVKAAYQDVLKQDYDFLKATPQVAVTLEGNADERGSTEYNLALGQKRAAAVKQTLKLLGMPEERMEAISYGEEKPRAACHEEKCWADNRRVDLAFRKSAAAK